MIQEIEINTRSRTEALDITSKIEEAIKKSGVSSGTAVIYVPHTTAAVVINENYDPKVGEDISSTLNRLIPQSSSYAHREGNADAHIKAAVVGSSRSIFFENGKLLFGTWQGIFFLEFDGPRRRKVQVKVIRD
jgi:secondary thiamine-phosphate synthase enzyme